MKILFVISSLGIGGEQRVANLLTNEFVQNDHQVELLVFGSKQEKMFAFNPAIDIAFCNLGEGTRGKLRKLKAVHAKMRSKRYDATIAFAIIPSIICSLASIGTATPVVVCERNDPASYSFFYKACRRIAYRICKGAVFQTQTACDCLPFLRDKLRCVIPNPLNEVQLPAVYEGERRKRIVNTARLKPAKNQMMLIQAFEQIQADYPDYTLDIYGDGPEKERLEAYIASNGLIGRVMIHPATADILNIIREDAIFVLSSDNEGFPNSLLEALALGIPSITTDCRIGGPKDMMEGKERGLLVETGSVDGMGKALVTLLTDEQLCNRYARNAVDIREELNVGYIAARWIDFLKEMTGAN